MLPGLRATVRAVRILPLLALLSAPASAGGGPRSEGDEPPSTAPAATQAPEDAEEPPPSRTSVRVFGDIDWASHRDDQPGTFALGQLDVFVTSELATNLTVLAEVVLETPNDEAGGEQIAEVERFQLQYSPWDALRVSVGRMHSMLGFWNQAYHHGSWLQTSAFRPDVYRWEDELGSVLPVHEVGVRLSGTAATSPLRVEYAASVVNGRASDPSKVNAVQDEDESKAVHLWVGFTPRKVPQLQVGGAAVFDRIPPDPGSPRRDVSLDETIWGGFVAYQGPHLEFLTEGFDVLHRDDERGLEWRTRGFYAQVAWAAGRFKPYYRFDRIDAGEGDPYYDGSVADLTRHTAGLRVDPWSRLALKLEISHAERGTSEPFSAAAVQAAFTF
jgi:hypothetical protein